MNSFIIRIYRREQNESGSLAGIVEDVERQTKEGFTSFNELWNILNPDGKKRGPACREKGHTAKRRGDPL